MKAVTLRCSKGEEFDVPRRAAELSEIIKELCRNGLANNVIPLPTIDGKTLSRIIDYLNAHADPERLPEELNEFDEKFAADEHHSVLFGLFMAAQNLGIKPLMQLVRRRIIAKIRNNETPAWYREVFRRAWGI